MKRSRSRPSLLVTCRRSSRRIVEIVVTGHAGSGPHGRDIVCAATSALVLSGAHGVTSHCKARVRVVDDGEGDYRLEIPRGGNARAQAVLETVVSGLRAIARSYPDKLRVRSVAGNQATAPKRIRPTRAARK